MTGIRPLLIAGCAACAVLCGILAAGAGRWWAAAWAAGAVVLWATWRPYEAAHADRAGLAGVSSLAASPAQSMQLDVDEEWEQARPAIFDQAIGGFPGGWASGYGSGSIVVAEWRSWPASPWAVLHDQAAADDDPPAPGGIPRPDVPAPGPGSDSGAGPGAVSLVTPGPVPVPPEPTRQASDLDLWLAAESAAHMRRIDNAARSIMLDGWADVDRFISRLKKELSQ